MKAENHIIAKSADKKEVRILDSEGIKKLFKSADEKTDGGPEKPVHAELKVLSTENAKGALGKRKAGFGKPERDLQTRSRFGPFGALPRAHS